MPLSVSVGLLSWLLRQSVLGKASMVSSCNVVVVAPTCFLATGCPWSSWRAESDQTGVRQAAGGVGLGGPAGRRTQLGGITGNIRKQEA